MDHAGLSLQLVRLKVLIGLSIKFLLLTLNNNLWIALETWATQVVMVAVRTLHSNMRRQPQLQLSNTILTQLKMETASKFKAMLKFPHLLMFQLTAGVSS